MIQFIQNIGDFFASNYFDEDFGKKVLEKSGHSADDLRIFNQKINALKPIYYRFKSEFLEGRYRTKDKVTHTHKFHTQVLLALGYPGDKPEYKELFHVDETTVLPVRHTLYRGSQPHLMIMEMHALIKEGDEEPDGLFEQQYNVENDTPAAVPPQKYHRSQWSSVFSVPDGLKISPMIINKAVSELFLLPQHRRPRYILLCAGNQYFLLEQEKWFRGSYLQIDLEVLFDEAAIRRDAFSLFYFLLAKETLAPAAEILLMEQLDEDSHKSAYEVTKDLKEGVIHAVEALANEAVFYLRQQGNDFSDLQADTLKDDCLTMVYRLLFLFYAESRADLDILPANDPVYQQGYSLEMLRDLEQVPLQTASSQNGFFFHDSLYRLFDLLSGGYREKDVSEASNSSFRIRHLDSPLFDNRFLHYLHKVKVRNVVWQDVICQLSLSRKQKGKNRGRISYANLGINQLGSVYESLLAFRGFFADTDHIEVHRKRKTNESSAQVAASDGSFLVPRHRIGDFHHSELFHDAPRGGEEELQIIPRGTFVYRLSGRDRQKSASYYTPEVLTQCTVKYTLKPILERLDRKEIKALDLLNLKILEPAMGAAAFHNEVINQLAESYLTYRQQELSRKVAPDKYREELQKIKAFIALNNVYGVDLNPTAVELGKLSLWLNVIHRDMETPFFGYRLGVGNAVVGAWFKGYKAKDFRIEKVSQSSQRSFKKDWWNKPPRHFSLSEKGIDRKKDEVYHFLLPDPGMVASADIALLKQTHPKEAEGVRNWKKLFCEPIRQDEYEKLLKISEAIDTLIRGHYEAQQHVSAATRSHLDFFGALEDGEQSTLPVVSYEEKARLAESRNRSEAPYYKLRQIMDYWCSLWFWDMRRSQDLPTRAQWYEELVQILNINLDEIGNLPDAGNPAMPESGLQTSLFGGEAQQLSLRTYRSNSGNTREFLALRLMQQPGASLFTNVRAGIVQEIAARYRFFHYELEFVEVFIERGGFDVAVGNPPWLKLQFEEKGLMAERYPELVIRNVSAPQVRKLQADFLAVPEQQAEYFAENIEHEASTAFMNAYQNYPLLAGQQTNLYKCVLENGFHWISEHGYLGLLHPEGVYDDPKGEALRKEMYQRLKFHFQFQNAFNLFAEVAHREKYGSHIYSGVNGEVGFYSIHNLFHPSTVDGCFIHSGMGEVGGIKVRDEASGEFSWNIHPHASRVVKIGEKELQTMAWTFENSTRWQGAKLVSVHARQILSILEKLGQFPTSVGDFENKITVCWDETNDRNAGNIERKTQYPDIEAYEMIYSGPHFFVGNPLYKTPREVCTEKGHYDIIDLTEIGEDYVARTNYVPPKVGPDYHSTIKGFETGKDSDGKPLYDDWLGYYKVGFRRRLSQAGERTLICSMFPPRSANVHPVITSIFKDETNSIELLGICSSLVFDFLIKTVGKSDLYESTLKDFPFDFCGKLKPALFSRTLLLNCLNKYYAPLWERHWDEAWRADGWSKEDTRLKAFDSLGPEWAWGTPLRNYYERRQALVEIDVITAMALGLELEELILMYNVQFPVLQQNEDDTWYDQRGNIVFTCSKGLTGVGVDRPVWNEIRHLGAGETYRHTIEKSELYQGKEVTYYAPFDKCDRVEDYRVAWRFFEGVFGE